MNKKRFDLIKLEEDLNSSYTDWKASNCERTRVKMFSSIEKLAFAILSVNKSPRVKNDLDELAYEYAVYLFERIILGVFVPVYDKRMPWQSYIDLNLKHIVFKKERDSWLDLVGDLENVINSENGEYESDDAFNDILSDATADVYSLLRVFYSKDDIASKFPLAVSILFSNDFKNKSCLNTLPDDIKDFVNTLILVSKRVVNSYNINNGISSIKRGDIDKVKAAAKSTLFLSSIVNSSFMKKELLLALDLESIHRLVLVLGGEKIRIPSQREFSTFVGSVAIASQAVFENKPVKKCITKVKKDMDFVFSHQINIQSYVSKIIESANINIDDKSQPVINSILSSIKFYKEIFNDYVQSICLNYSKESVSSLKSVGDAIDDHIKMMQSIRDTIQGLTK